MRWYQLFENWHDLGVLGLKRERRIGCPSWNITRGRMNQEEGRRTTSKQHKIKTKMQMQFIKTKGVICMNAHDGMNKRQER